MSKPDGSAEAEVVRAPLPGLVMTPEVASATLQFLTRGPIQVMVGEAETLLRVRMTLESIARGAGE